MEIFMKGVSETFGNYRIIMAMDTCAAQSASRASWHKNITNEKWENIVPLFQPPYSPETNPVENLWHHIREDGGFTCTVYPKGINTKYAVSIFSCHLITNTCSSSGRNPTRRNVVNSTKACFILKKQLDGSAISLIVKL